VAERSWPISGVIKSNAVRWGLLRRRRIVQPSAIPSQEMTKATVDNRVRAETMPMSGDYYSDAYVSDVLLAVACVFLPTKLSGHDMVPRLLSCAQATGTPRSLMLTLRIISPCPRNTVYVSEDKGPRICTPEEIWGLINRELWKPKIAGRHVGERASDMRGTRPLTVTVLQQASV
jgi:hypothetical protein